MLSLRNIKSTIQKSLYTWFTAKYSNISKSIDFPFQDIIVKDEWKNSIFYGRTTYHELLILAYQKRAVSKTDPRRIYSSWLPDISIHLLSTLLFGGILIIEEEIPRNNSFSDEFLIDVGEPLPESYIHDIKLEGIIYFKGKKYSCDYLLKSVGNFVSILQEDELSSIFDTLQNTSLDTDHSIENLILLIYSLLLGKTIEPYSIECHLNNQILPMSEYLLSERSIWKPNYRPIHTVFVYSRSQGKISMIAKSIKDSISIRCVLPKYQETSISNDIVYKIDMIDREEVTKKTYTINHYLKNDRHWLRKHISSILWKKIIWIPSQKQIQIIQPLGYTDFQKPIQTIQNKPTLPNIPIYQRILLILILPLLVINLYWKPTKPVKTQQLFWNYHKKTIWQDWLPEWIQTTFPYICWIWTPDYPYPLFAIGGKLIWGKWKGWSFLCFLIMMSAKSFGFNPSQVIHIRILDFSNTLDKPDKQPYIPSITYSSTKNSLYISICQYPDKTYVYANIPSKITQSLRDQLTRVKNENNTIHS